MSVRNGPLLRYSKDLPFDLYRNKATYQPTRTVIRRIRSGAAWNKY